jgi:type IV pilus assembly protein PilW
MRQRPLPQTLLNRQRGLNMVELMVALAIGLFLLVGLVGVFASSNRAYLELNRSAQQIENGRFAVQILSDDLAIAGYYGRYYSSLAAPASLPDPCTTSPASALRTATPLVVQGYNAPGSSPITGCLAAADHVAGTDILVLRRADAQETAVASLAASEVYIQTNADPNNLSNPVVALGSGGGAAFPLTDRDGSTKSRIRKYHVHIYYVAPCSVPAGGGTTCTGAADDGGAPIPTLKRMELIGASGIAANDWRVVPLVEGIENFQVDYGLDADGDGVHDGAYTADPATVASWMNVVTVRLNVLARNLEATSGYTDAKVYDMGVAGTVTPGGAFKRHVYNSVVRIVNPSSRREPTS